MSKTYSVEITYRGEITTLDVPEDKYILGAAYAAGMEELPSACLAGVCTTCAAKILNDDGQVDQSDVMGLSPDLQAQKYVLLCKAKPRSDLKIEADKENEVYERQFGQS